MRRLGRNSSASTPGRRACLGSSLQHGRTAPVSCSLRGLSPTGWQPLGLISWCLPSLNAFKEQLMSRHKEDGEAGHRELVIFKFQSRARCRPGRRTWDGASGPGNKCQKGDSLAQVHVLEFRSERVPMSSRETEHYIVLEF